MMCGYCRRPFAGFEKWNAHVKETGCNWHREAWVKYMSARRRGSSGRRHLSRAMPHLWKPGPPMSEETKERLREISAKRVKVKKSTVEMIREAAMEAKRKKRKPRKVLA